MERAGIISKVQDRGQTGHNRKHWIATMASTLCYHFSANYGNIMCDFPCSPFLTGSFHCSYFVFYIFHDPRHFMKSLYPFWSHRFSDHKKPVWELGEMDII